MNGNVRRGHVALWRKFFNPQTNLVYDIEITDPAILPTAEEVAASIPNCAGWGTGMEDCALDGGFVLDGLVMAHQVERRPEWARRARQVFKGLVALGTASPMKGFVARGFAPGRRDVYPNSSADQFTAFVYGVWRYARSAIARPAERRKAAEMLVDIARLVESFHHDIPRADLKPSIYGDTSSLDEGRACRLLQFYKAAHDLSGDQHWQDVYMQKVEEDERIRLTRHYGPGVWDLNRNVHCVIQSQAAFRLLSECETDGAIRESYRNALRAEALSVVGRIRRWREIVAQPPGGPRAPRWRLFWPGFVEANPGYDMARHEDVQKFSRYCREHAKDIPVPEQELAKAAPVLPWLRHQTESLATVMLCEDAELKKQAAESGWPMIQEVDWASVGQCAVWAGLEMAYWHGVASGIFPRE